MGWALNASASEHLKGSAPVTVSPWTISIWVKVLVDALSAIAALADVSLDTNYWRMQFRNTGDELRAIFQNGGGAAAFNVSGNLMPLGIWHYCVWRENNNVDRAIWIDGTKFTNSSNRTPTGIDNLVFGATATLTVGEFFGGTLAEPGIWNIGLTDSEIEDDLFALKKAPTLVRRPSLTFYRNFIRDSSSPAIGPVLTEVNGGVAVADHPPGIIYQLGLRNRQRPMRRTVSGYQWT